MANDLNYCSFIGRLGKDVETRYIPSGDAVANFSIAVGWKGKDKEGAEWVNVVAWRKLAEICSKYLAKGSRVFISGKMRTRKWQDQSGNDRYSTEIVADQMQLLDSRQVGGGDSSSHDGGRFGPKLKPEPSKQQNGGFDDDIPFANPYKGMEHMV